MNNTTKKGGDVEHGVTVDAFLGRGGRGLTCDGPSLAKLLSLVITRACPQCGVTKLKDEFYRTGRDSWSGWCKECHKEWSKQQRATGYLKDLRAKKRPQGVAPHHKNDAIEKCARALWSNIVKRNKHRRISVDITWDWLHDAVRKFCATHHYQLGARIPFQPSVDRIDHRKGYIVGNVQIVWLIENYARNTFTEEELVEFCRRKLGLY
jgi:hypothetical protein